MLEVNIHPLTTALYCCAPRRFIVNTQARNLKAHSSRSAISVNGLTKSYGNKTVLEGINLEVPEGTVFGLLGPNGAGKTTLVQILSTYLRANAGKVMIAGHNLARDPNGVRGAIGVTGQFSSIDNLLSGEENLLLMADLYHLNHTEGRKRTKDLLERFDLMEAAKKPAALYSGGMRRRLDLAMTLVGNPRIIFLDEPTTGLDPSSRQTMWQIVRELVSSGITLFLTTQYLDEADQLADRIAVLSGGKVVAEGTPAELKRRIPGGHIRLKFSDLNALERAANTLGEVRRNEIALEIQVPSDGSVHSLRAVLERLEQAGIEVETLSIHIPDLDDVFFALTDQTRPQEARA